MEETAKDGPSDGRQPRLVGSPVRGIQQRRFDAFALLNADRASVLRSRGSRSAL
jgi:hypothetical protein